MVTAETPVLYASHNNATEEAEGGNTNVAKSLAIVILFCTSFIIGALPIKLNTWCRWNSNAKDNPYVKCLLGLGAGVLLCTTFIHLIPEVSEAFEELDLTPDFEIPYAMLCMCMGFLIMYFVEECVHLYLHQRNKSKGFAPVRNMSIRRDNFGDLQKGDSLVPPDPLVESANTQNRCCEDHVDHSHMIIDYSETAQSTVAIIRGLLVVGGLAVHELFEGLAIGLERSTGQVWYMFGAVSAHKLVIAFCIGVEMVTSGLKTVFVLIYIFIFAVVSPLGIGIGMIVTNIQEGSGGLVSVILQGMASGTLTYLVFFEILQGDRKKGIKQFFSVSAGFIIMFGITLIDLLG